MSNNKDTANPPGTYKLKEQAKDDYVWAVRTTANKQFDDNVLFKLSPSDDGNGTIIKAKSQSKEFALYDNNVNFCNSFNVVRQVSDQVDIGKGYKIGDALLNQTDASACGRY